MRTVAMRARPPSWSMRFMDHMERRPDESLGVVTLNFEQGELIEEYAGPAVEN